MQNIALIGTILAIHVFAWLTPGPLFVLIVRNSLVYSRKIGIWTAVGFAIGNFIHILYSVTGIALFISQSILAFTAIKFLGVAYLLYLGIKTFFFTIPKTEPGIQHKQTDIAPFAAVKIGFLTNILSPKASLFFASIFATVLASGAPLWVVGFLMLAMPLNSLFMASLLSTFFTHSKIRAAYGQHHSLANKGLGTMLILFALAIAFSK